VNLLDGGAHFYNVYECSDGKWISVASIEPQFYALLLKKAQITDPDFDKQMDRSLWPRLRQRMARVIAEKPRDYWCALMEGSDVCFAPVLDLAEAPLHPQNLARGTFVEVEGVVQPAPAPRFSVTPGAIRRPPAKAGAHNHEALKDWGVSASEISALEAEGAM
jgi:alpha-methylacyl-CoA racemase